MMDSDWSNLTRMERYDDKYSESEFKAQLKEVDLSSKECKDGKDGWVFWRSCEGFEQLLEGEYLDELANIIITPLDLLVSSSDYISEREIKEKVKRFLEEMISWEILMVQFWAPEVDEEQQQYVYLTTAHQPFAVGHLGKGCCWYRQRCMHHRYRVDEEAAEEELGAVGRVYRNKRPESTPDLRLYSTTEFPLRDVAARCGLRKYLALPVFDLPKEKCYGVIEVLIFLETGIHSRLEGALKAAQLRTTHLNLYKLEDVDSEITQILELAIRAMPQLQMAQAWFPCHECFNTGNNLSCMERATFVHAGNEEVNSEADEYDIRCYDGACKLHNLEIGNYRNMIAAVMSSNNKSCICRNICDFSISENPLAHYAQKARLSFCFAICLQNLHKSSDFYVLEFFLHCNSTKDAVVGSFLSLLLRIMNMKLENFMFPYKGHCGEEIIVEILKENMPSFGESSQSIALQYESIKYKLQHSEELSSLLIMVMEGCEDKYLISDFAKYLQKADLHYLQTSREIKHGWTFWSWAVEESSENEVNSNSSLLSDAIQEKIKRLMNEIISGYDWDSYALAQFWAPKMDGERCYLETLDQPFALRRLHKGLAYFRKQCMEHHYFVDEAAKEEELGPPGRVFLNRHPEITPDLHLYSPTEFPLRNDAAHCCLRKYFALPIFNLSQHGCVGVLELVGFSDSSLKVIGNALEVANLSSAHINFKPGLQGSHVPGDNAECWQLALTEIKEACKLFDDIPQLHMAEVWVPCSKCPSINNKLSCMERVCAIGCEWEFDWPMRTIKHVETGKGIAGMTLTSENKSCLGRNLCGFGIADEPRAHYAQRARLDVCFTICLHSRHTGNLLYVLEFYLNQGPWKYEYLRSFLRLLTSIMKQTLKSFKVASGQQLGEKLVVEVIEFLEVNELDFSEVDQPDVLPIRFKFVNYRTQEHSKDKQVHSAPEVMESVRIDAQPEHASTSAANLNEKKAAKETKEGKRETRLNISLNDLESHFGKKRMDAAKALCISLSTFKRRCKECGIKRWPDIENHKKNPSLFMRETANESARDSQQNMGLSSCSNPPPSDIALQQNAPHSDLESSQGLVVQPKVDMVIVYAKYENKTIKFKLYHSAGMGKLVKEVATRLNLNMGHFELQYLDEVINEKILLTCDADLELCLESLTAAGKPYIQLFVQSI